MPEHQKKKTKTAEILLKLWGFLSPKEKINAIKIIIILTIVSIFEIVTMLSISLFAKILMGNQDVFEIPYFGKCALNDSTIKWVGIFVIFSYLIKNILSGYELFFSHKSVQGINFRFQRSLVDSFLNADLTYLKNKNNSEYLTILTHDCDQAFTFGLAAFSNFISESFVLLFLSLTVFFIYPKVTLLMFLVIVFFSLVVKFLILPYFSKIGKEMATYSEKSNKFSVQLFTSFKEVFVYNRRDVFLNKFSDAVEKKLTLRAAYSSLNGLPRIVIESLFVFVFMGVTYVLFDSSTEGNASLVSMLSIYLYLGFRLMPSLNRIINSLNTFKFGVFSTERALNSLTELKKCNVHVEDVRFEFKKKVSLKNISFSFSKSKQVLKDITLEVKKGQCVGVVGSTGSGKSTLIDLFLGLLSAESGNASVDGVYPIRSLGWLNKIGYVSQAIYLLDDTIENNIAFGDQSIEPEKVKKSIERAQLGELVAALPEKEKTIIGENGVRLSGGERQRIAIARALYRDPEVLIFDEATSALDNETEKKLMDTIYDVSKNRTVIMVAHRLSTLEKCDKIIVLEKGKIKETTTYDELVKNKKKD